MLTELIVNGNEKKLHYLILQVMGVNCIHLTFHVQMLEQEHLDNGVC